MEEFKRVVFKLQDLPTHIRCYFNCVSEFIGNKVVCTAMDDNILLKFYDRDGDGEKEGRAEDNPKPATLGNFFYAAILGSESFVKDFNLPTNDFLFFRRVRVNSVPVA